MRLSIGCCALPRHLRDLRSRRRPSAYRVWTSRGQRQAGLQSVALRITEAKCGDVRGSLFVKIHTNQGIWGCGEAVDAVQGTYHMVRTFGERLRNQNPLNVHRLFEQIRKGGVFGGAQSGVFIAVLSALETALWDLAGKALNLPVYQLLGGKFRDRIRVYLDTALYQVKQPRPEQFAQAASQAAKDGYSAVKFDLDQGNDPNKYDAFNWTASPAEIQRMVDQMTAARAGRRAKHRYLRRHARPLRLSDRAAGGQADGAVEPDVAGRTGTGGERRRIQADRSGGRAHRFVPGRTSSSLTGSGVCSK